MFNFYQYNNQKEKLFKDMGFDAQVLKKNNRYSSEASFINVKSSGNRVST